METVPFPRTGAPALRALAAAGYTHLGQLDGVPMGTVLGLHGMGPRGIGALRRALADHGWSFADDDPTVGAAPGGRVRVEAGLQPERSANATAPTGVDPVAWVDGLQPVRRAEQGRAMLSLFGEVTGEEPVMWGPSIVGYGAVHYTYESGREGDMCRVGFSPRASALTLYGLQDAPGSSDLFDRLGRHRRTVACVYVSRLTDVDPDVLRLLVRRAWQHSDPGR